MVRILQLNDVGSELHGGFMKRLSLLLIFLFVVMLSFVGCSRVTETGNPCPLGDCVERPNQLPDDPVGSQEPPDAASPAPDEEEDDLDWYEIKENALYVAVPDAWAIIQPDAWDVMNSGVSAQWPSVVFTHSDDNGKLSYVIIKWQSIGADYSVEDFADMYFSSSSFSSVSAGEVGAGMLVSGLHTGYGEVTGNYLTVVGDYGLNIIVRYYSTTEDDVELFLSHIVDSH
jgi:hypothetical protein